MGLGRSASDTQAHIGLDFISDQRSGLVLEVLSVKSNKKTHYCTSDCSFPTVLRLSYLPCGRHLAMHGQ